MKSHNTLLVTAVLLTVWFWPGTVSAHEETTHNMRDISWLEINVRIPLEAQHTSWSLFLAIEDGAADCHASESGILLSLSEVQIGGHPDALDRARRGIAALQAVVRIAVELIEHWLRGYIWIQETN